jgi:hypothetical protein
MDFQHRVEFLVQPLQSYHEIRGLFDIFELGFSDYR